MRLTREELKRQYFPNWNDSRHDIVAVNYGDEPLIRYNQQKYEEYQKLTSSLANIETVSAYIYSQNGNYDEYRTLAGNVYIAEDGRVLGGSVNVKYNGQTVSVSLNLMYGLQALTILQLTKIVQGFSNKDGNGSSSRYTEEMKPEKIEKILNNPMCDYGIAIQKFLEAAREQYKRDTTNHIMNQRFGVREDR